METNKTTEEIILMIEEAITRYHQVQLVHDKAFNEGKEKAFSWNMSQEYYHNKMALCFLLADITEKPIEQIVKKYCKERGNIMLTPEEKAAKSINIMIREKEKILFFLEGIYYAGNLPSKVETENIARHLRPYIVLPFIDLRKLVEECIDSIHMRVNGEKEQK